MGMQRYNVRAQFVDAVKIGERFMISAQAGCYGWAQHGCAGDYVVSMPQGGLKVIASDLFEKKYVKHFG